MTPDPSDGLVEATDSAFDQIADTSEIIEVVGTEAPGMVQGVLGENNTEYLNWLLDNPQLAMAPGMVELATGRSEWDEENYPGYDGPGPSWTTGPGTAQSPSWSSGGSTGSASRPSWAARDGGEVRRRRVGVTLPFRQGGLASNNLRSGGLGSLRRP